MVEAPDIIWLASYPKSGNTWLRFLLASYFFGPPASSIEVGERIPDIHKIREIPPFAGHDLGLGIATPGRRVVFSKTHLAAATGHPYWSQTAAAIVIVRHPADVLLSNLNFLRLEGGPHSQQVTDERYARIFVQSGGDPRWYNSGFGTLDMHLASWQCASSFPRLAVRYEDLKVETTRTLRRVIEFLRPAGGVDEVKLSAAVEASSLERMRKLEMEEKKAGKRTIFEGTTDKAKQGETFVREGRSAQTLSHLGMDLDIACEQRFANYMAITDYERRFAAHPSASQMFK